MFIFNGFILTMWYINKEEVAIDELLDFGFILTMWYINNL